MSLSCVSSLSSLPDIITVAISSFLELRDIFRLIQTSRKIQGVVSRTTYPILCNFPEGAFAHTHSVQDMLQSLTRTFPRIRALRLQFPQAPFVRSDPFWGSHSAEASAKFNPGVIMQFLQSCPAPLSALDLFFPECCELTVFEMMQPQPGMDVQAIFTRHPLVSFVAYDLCVEAHTLQAMLMAVPQLCSLGLGSLAFWNDRTFKRNALHPLRPQILQAIGRLSALQRLDLHSWNLSNQEVASLVPHLPELRHLGVGSFQHSPLTDEALPIIARYCPRLHHLDVKGTAVTLAGLVDLLKSLQLFELELDNTFIEARHLRDIVMASQTLRIVSYGRNEFEMSPTMRASLVAADEACSGATVMVHWILGVFESQRNEKTRSKIRKVTGSTRLSTHDPYNLSPDEWHSTSLVRCSACNTPSRALKLCSRCRSARYCGPTCQRTAWPTHRNHCKAF